MKLHVPEAYTGRVSGRGILPENTIALTEGYFFGLSGLPETDGGPLFSMLASPVAVFTSLKVFPIQVVEVGEKGVASIRVPLGAAGELKSGDLFHLIRPAGSSTAELRAVGDVLPVADARFEVQGLRPADAVHLFHSVQNLRQIGVAMHNFHTAYDCLPPAVIYGPDGKPWHSWRVLLLPYLDHKALYDRYDFSQPWDSPANKPVLDSMPSVYRDPIHDDRQSSYTHYAAITGPGTAFPAEGVQFDGQSPPLGSIISSASSVGFSDFIDGVSSTILVGSLSPDRKIPWTKPEDIGLGEKCPPPGQEGGFAAPYKTDETSGGVFLFADAQVATIRTDIDKQTWRRLIQIADGNPVGDVPALVPLSPPQPVRCPVIEITRREGKLNAQLKLAPLK